MLENADISILASSYSWQFVFIFYKSQYALPYTTNVKGSRSIRPFIQKVQESLWSYKFAESLACLGLLGNFTTRVTQTHREDSF